MHRSIQMMPPPVWALHPTGENDLRYLHNRHYPRYLRKEEMGVLQSPTESPCSVTKIEWILIELGITSLVVLGCSRGLYLLRSLPAVNQEGPG